MGVSDRSSKHSAPVSRFLAKISVRCPHCGSQQQESAQARSTICRGCSESFDITAAISAPAGSVSSPPRLTSAMTMPSLGSSQARPQSPESAAQSPDAGGSLRERLGRMLGSPPKNQFARCFECNGVHEVSGSARSTICRDCGAYIDLQDYKITGSFSRNIATRGTVVVSRNGVLSSSKIICANALIYGKLRGNLLCTGKVTLRVRGRLPGSLEAAYLVIEKGSDIEFGLPIKVTGLDVAGRMSAQIISDGHVNVHRSGHLSGPVRAKGFTVEKGGVFEGELTISPGETFVSALAKEHKESPAIEPTRRAWAESAELIEPDPLAG